MISPIPMIRVTKASSQEKWVIIGGVFGLSVFLGLLITAAISLFRPERSNSTAKHNLPQNVLEASSERLEYSDPVCQVNFIYPGNWQASQTAVPLPGKPLHAVTFGGQAKVPYASQPAVLSYICLDAKQYSFEQLVGNSNLKSQVEAIGNHQWQRFGSFAATIIEDKLIVLYMPYTRYDLKPRAGYEDVFLTILQSVKANN